MSKATAAIKKERAEVRRQLRTVKREVKDLGKRDKALTTALEVMQRSEGAASSSNGRGPDQVTRRVPKQERADQVVAAMHAHPERKWWNPTQLSEAMGGAPIGSLYEALRLAEQRRVQLREGEGAMPMLAALVTPEGGR
jgi:hypothetical protein